MKYALNNSAVPVAEEFPEIAIDREEELEDKIPPAHESEDDLLEDDLPDIFEEDDEKQGEVNEEEIPSEAVSNSVPNSSEPELDLDMLASFLDDIGDDVMEDDLV